MGNGWRRARRGMAAAVLVIGAVIAARPAWAGGDWNDAQIKWQPYEEGLAAAKAEKKPVCLVFYTEWCPHCRNYSGVFHDAKIVEMAKHFVMIRLNKDEHADVSSKYAPDGQYIPRTYFLSSAGVLDEALHAPREQFKYFYDERAPASLLAGMEAALTKLR